jgi:hypothetical protein
MKRYVLIACFFELFFLNHAQGNLQFNQILRPTVTGINIVGYGKSSTSITIPPGKIWKIESSDVYCYTSTYPENLYWSNSFCLRLGGQLVSNITDNFWGLIKPQFPIWLPAGNYNLTLFETSGSNFSNTTIVGLINVIEFNIIP